MEWTHLSSDGVVSELEQEGPVLTLHSVTRDSTGAYICSAKNGVGKPAKSQVSYYQLNFLKNIFNLDNSACIVCSSCVVMFCLLLSCHHCGVTATATKTFLTTTN